MAINRPSLDGLTVARRLHQRLSEWQTLVLTELTQPGNRLLAIKVHVRDFVPKDAPAQNEAGGIRRVARGERVIDPQLIAREADVGRAAASGISPVEIAVRRSLSPATVRHYLSSEVSKLRRRNRVDAIGFARDAGWLRPGMAIEAIPAKSGMTRETFRRRLPPANEIRRTAPLFTGRRCPGLGGRPSLPRRDRGRTDPGAATERDRLHCDRQLTMSLGSQARRRLGRLHRSQHIQEP